MGSVAASDMNDRLGPHSAYRRRKQVADKHRRYADVTTSLNDAILRYAAIALPVNLQCFAVATPTSIETVTRD